VRLSVAGSFAAVLVAVTLANPPVAFGDDGASFHKITVDLNPATGSMTVEDTIRLNEGGLMEFRLAPWLDVETVSREDRPIDYDRRNGHLAVNVPKSGNREIRFRLKGRIPHRNGGSGGGFAMAVSGDAGTYLPGNAAWFPLTGHDGSRFRLDVSTPAPYRTRSTGRLIEETVSNGVHRSVFESEDPSEAPSLFAGPYRVKEEEAGGIRVRTYLHPEIAGLADVYLERSHLYLDMFSKAIGAYPYADFSLVSSPLPVGLGFPGIAYVGRRVLPLPFMRGRSLAHEVAHNWWGNAVGIDYGSGNWAEGLTTFMADYGLALEAGPAEARLMRTEWLRDYAALPRSRDTAITAFVSKRHDAAQVIGYNKVAYVFHMLSREIGGDAFSRGIREFWRTNKGRRAAWSDIQQAFEKSTKQDLDWFFGQWLKRPGAPQLRLERVEKRRQEGRFVVRFEIEQTSPTYRLTLPVAADIATGRIVKEVVLDRQRKSFELTYDENPRTLTVDPDFHVFRRLAPEESPPVLRDILLAPDAVTHIESDDDAFVTAATGLAERLLDVDPKPDTVTDQDFTGKPLLVIGETHRLSAFLEGVGTSPQATTPAPGGTARAWTFRRQEGTPVLVVSAEDTIALKAVMRPLPHYKRRSYIVFDGPKAIDKGTWPMDDGPLVHRFAD